MKTLCQVIILGVLIADCGNRRES